MLRNVGLINMLAKGIKIALAPLTLLVLSFFMSAEELGFYFTFLNIVAIQNLIELGVGRVLKQYILHSEDDVEKRRLTNFSKCWFKLISVVFFIIVFPLGVMFFNLNYEGDINWIGPWFFTVLSVSVVIHLNYYLVIFESSLRQMTLYKTQLMSTIINSLSLATLISQDFGLYSYALASLIASLFFHLNLNGKYKNLVVGIENQEFSFDIFKSTLKSIKELLVPVIKVSVVGYFFWNTINLVAFSRLGANEAGILGLSITAVRSIMLVSNSYIFAYVPNFTKLNAQNLFNDSIKAFIRKYIIANAIFLSGAIALIFIIIVTKHVDHVISKKFIDAQQLAILVLFFLIISLTSGLNEYVRTFKVEPFFIQSLLNTVFCVGSMLVFLNSFENLTFTLILCIVTQSITLISSIIILRKKLDENSNIQL